MKPFLISATIVLLLNVSSCKIGSSCFINPINGEIVLNDTSKVSHVKVFILEDGQMVPKASTLDKDSLTKLTSWIYIYTTDYRSTYVKKMQPADWNKDKLLKCGFLVK